jgi:hypothetical protein
MRSAILLLANSFQGRQTIQLKQQQQKEEGATLDQQIAESLGRLGYGF